jgi:ATPase subunit of ABC transporter with duplicated ATPase domains
VNARAYISRFNFTGADQQKKLGVCSGGERNRVHLAMTLKDGGNVLLLDEPTNDIDVNTLRALEDAIDNFAGCVLIISHDRWFLDRLATHILSFEDEGQVVFFEGSFSGLRGCQEGPPRRYHPRTDPGQTRHVNTCPGMGGGILNKLLHSDPHAPGQ